ncbi:MAG: DUF3127 domain-containing protein [Oleispira sp.]|nr:DUF3127 domain-containing protein [Oleispira sp.]
MSEFQVTGNITQIAEVKEGTTKAGDAFKTLSFLVDTGEEYNNIYSFDLYQSGEKDNIDKFLQYNKVGQNVDVKFNVRTNEYKEKYYTSLQAWSIFSNNVGTTDINGSSPPF